MLHCPLRVMSYRKLLIVKEPMLGMLIYLLAGLLAIVIWKGLAELAKLDQARLSSGEGQRLEGALRAGALEFDKYHERIVIEQPQVIAASPATGDPVPELTASVRNDTGRVIKGLEVRGTVVDPQGSGSRSLSRHSRLRLSRMRRSKRDSCSKPSDRRRLALAFVWK